MTKAHSMPDDNDGRCERCDESESRWRAQTKIPVQLGGGMGMGTMWVCATCLTMADAPDVPSDWKVTNFKCEAEFNMRHAIEWYQGHDTGISSETIWSVMTGYPCKKYDIPHDAGDFGRCHRLLEKFPAWRNRLSEIEAHYPAWKPFVAAWSELTRLFIEERSCDWMVTVGECPKLESRIRLLKRFIAMQEIRGVK